MENTISRRGFLKAGLAGLLTAAGCATTPRITDVKEVYNPLDEFKGKQVYQYNLNGTEYTAKSDDNIYEKVMKQSPSYRCYQTLKPDNFGPREEYLIQQFDKLEFPDNDKEIIGCLYPWINLDRLTDKDKVFLMKIINAIEKANETIATLQSLF